MLTGTKTAIRAGKRALYFAHRWLGIITCIFCLIWFISGLVMVYVQFPAWTEAERLATLHPIDVEKIARTPDEALAVAGLKAQTTNVRLEMYGTEPVYRLGRGESTQAVSAVAGRLISSVSLDEARARLASVYPEASIDYLGPVERDQWTVTRRFDGHRPLYLFTLGDRAGTNIYVSSKTGEIVQNSTYNERFWNWLGAIPHWVYFTPIRTDGEFWRQAVMWLSGPLIIGGITGLWIGILRLRLRRPYSRGRMTPYRGWMKWHHIGGLVGGVFLTTWIFSGWLSVNPFGFFARTQFTLELKQRYTGAKSEFGIPISALKAAARSPVTALEMNFVSGESLIVAKSSPQQKQLFDGATGTSRTLDPKRLTEAAEGLLPKAHLTRTEVLTEEDIYWYSHHHTRPLPVLRFVFDDENATWIHIDPATGDLAGLSDTSERTHRWLFNFLHDFDLPVLLRYQPARDILIWMLSIAGIIISISGIVVGWRYLARKADQRAMSATRQALEAKSSS
ncbi:peptidase [Hyphomicrobium methylovorum]|uniref:PepSY domain-containing protein n=1 Tax=Hyphomicrobium methylovorum TaxID=84 RepID=UPI0015E6EC0C|nr:PepSY domain-containing protein [Hyphomicrobium methylovorum]MBA2125442.1 peptidase [Hyphomicrobium methylovorum]